MFPASLCADMLLGHRRPRGPEASNVLKSHVALGMLSPPSCSESLGTHMAALRTPAPRVRALGNGCGVPFCSQGPSLLVVDKKLPLVVVWGHSHGTATHTRLLGDQLMPNGETAVPGGLSVCPRSWIELVVGL